MPLDPVDFVPRPFVGGVRWPIGYDDVARYYATACRYVGCGEAAFTLAAPGLSAANDDFEFDRIERASNRPWFQKAHAATLAASPLIDIRLGATVVEIEFAENGRATGVVAATADGRRLRLAAERIALAAGGLESTRLLLAAQRRRPALFGGADGPLGRYYMGHVIGEIADVVFDDARVDAAFDFLRDGRGSFVRRRFAPSPVADGALRPAQRRLLAGGPADRRPASRQRRALGRRDGAVDADRRRHDPAGADPRPPSRRVDRLARPCAQRRFRPAGDRRLSRPLHARSLSRRRAHSRLLPAQPRAPLRTVLSRRADSQPRQPGDARGGDPTASACRGCASICASAATTARRSRAPTSVSRCGFPPPASAGSNTVRAKRRAPRRRWR